MSESDDFYTPENVDEQVDALLHTRKMSFQDQHMAQNLRSILLHLTKEQKQADAQALQRVLQKMLHSEHFPHEQGEYIAPFTDLILPTQKQGRFGAMPKTQKQFPLVHRMNPVLRPLSTLAAILVVAILVGSLLFALNATRQKSNGTPGTRTGAAAQNSVRHEGQIVYKSQEFSGGSAAAWSPDGSRIAFATAIKGGVESWDARTGQHILHYPTDGDPYLNSPAHGDIYIVNVAWSPDGADLAVASSTKIYLFNAQTAQLLHVFPAPSVALNGSAASPFTAPGVIKSVVPLSSEIPFSGGSNAEFENVAWSPDGKDLTAAFNGTQNVVYVWDAHTGSVLKTLTSFQETILNVSWSPNGKWLSTLAVASGTGILTVAKLWNTTTWQVVQQYTNVANLAWSPDGKQLALVETKGGIWGSNGKDVRIVDALTGQTTVKPFGGSQTAIITNINWAPQGNRLALEQQATSGAPTKVTLWSTTGGTLLYSFTSESSIYKAAWSPDGKYLSTTENGADSGVYIVIWEA